MEAAREEIGYDESSAAIALALRFAKTHNASVRSLEGGAEYAYRSIDNGCRNCDWFRGTNLGR